LDCYEDASGQKVNREKTSLFFSKYTKENVRLSLSRAVGVNPTQRYERYLGLMAFIGKSKVSSFNGIKGRIWAKMNGWKEQFISHAGKEILLKAVLQAIPTYSMRVFQLPKTLCREINSLMAKFWWGHNENTSKISWMSWSKLERSKNTCGLGYRDLEAFNMGLLAKQGWRLVQHPETLVARVFREKYHSGGSFLESQHGWRPSFAWRSIWNSKSLLKECLMWKVGTGESIKIWGDQWLPHNSHALYPPPDGLDEQSTVDSLINQDSNWWNVPYIESIFSADVVAQICSLGISPGSQDDRLIWAGTKNGEFSVRSAYYLEVERRSRSLGTGSLPASANPFWKVIWKLKVPRAVQVFLWWGCNNILPTKEKLFHRKVVSDPFCPLCGTEVKTAGHFLCRCEWSTGVWAECPIDLSPF
jgi:hypothetical protein